MSYADIASRMSSKDSKDNKRFEVSLDQLLFKHYNQNAVFKPELCTKEEVDTFIRYITTYGGGDWSDDIRNETPYCLDRFDCTKIVPLGDVWQDIQDMIKDTVAPRLYNYQKCKTKSIIIPYPGINKEYEFVNSYIQFCESVNAMQSYYNRFKYTDDVQAKILEIISAIRSAMEDVFSGMLKYYSTDKVDKLYNTVSVDYCAYRIDGTFRYAPDACFVGGLDIAERSDYNNGYTHIDGRLTDNNIKALIKSAGADYDATMRDAMSDGIKDGSPMEFRLYDNYGKYGYCVRVMSGSKSLLTIILRELTKKCNYNGVENFNG